MLLFANLEQVDQQQTNKLLSFVTLSKKKEYTIQIHVFVYNRCKFSYGFEMFNAWLSTFPTEKLRHY